MCGGKKMLKKHKEEPQHVALVRMWCELSQPVIYKSLRHQLGSWHHRKAGWLMMASFYLQTTSVRQTKHQRGNNYFKENCVWVSKKAHASHSSNFLHRFLLFHRPFHGNMSVSCKMTMQPESLDVRLEPKQAGSHCAQACACMLTCAADFSQTCFHLLWAAVKSWRWCHHLVPKASFDPTAEQTDRRGLTGWANFEGN